MIRPVSLAATLVFTAAAAAAHAGEAAGGGFLTGFPHPVLGWDHVAAMVAVGLWGAFLGPPAIWLLPVTFPLVMALGGALGVAGVPVPGIELGIAASALIIGLAALLAWRPPLVIAAVVVGFFAIFHGHAHGTEMPEVASPLAHAAGFVIGTGLLRLAGIALAAAVLGLAALAGRDLGRLPTVAIAAAGAVAAGLAIDLPPGQRAGALAALGGALGIALTGLLVWGLVDLLQRRLGRVAGAVAGSWIAAVGIKAAAFAPAGA